MRYSLDAEYVQNNKPVVILVEPQLGENIGAVARAMLNCGLDPVSYTHLTLPTKA